MPRYTGIGMPKAKKKAVFQLSEAQEECPAPPSPSEPPAPPSASPDSKQVGRKRPAQSPGTSAVKQAAYAAKKAARAANKAHIGYLKAKLEELKFYPLVVARMHGIMRSWQKTGNKKAFSHLKRMSKAELEKATRVIPTLEASVHALTLAVDARDAIIGARDARIVRLSRLLRMRKRMGRR